MNYLGFLSQLTDAPAFWPWILLAGLAACGGWLHFRTRRGCSRRLKEISERLEGEIAEHRTTQEQLNQLLFYDALTGLPNRALFRDRLLQAVAESRRRKNRVAVIFVELDWARVMVDTLGPGAEDELLAAVARDLRSCLRLTDTISRLSSHEFTAILPHAGEAAQTAEVAQRLLESSNRLYEVRGGRVFVRVRIGIALAPRDTVEAEELMRFASTAVHLLRESGRYGYAFYDGQLTAETVERLALEAELRDAIDKGHLILYYQPIVDLTSGQMIAVEALVRLNHPLKGLITAGDFIPLAEETGWVTGIGSWVLEEACRQVRSWQEEGFPHLRLSVNVSTRLLEQDGFVEHVDGILARTELQPEHLELEVTEYLLMDDNVSNRNVLQDLRQRRIRISVDDFGTGYSALSYLTSFPIDTLKIDRSLIKDAPYDHGAGEVARAIIAMANGLELLVVAEGIEQTEQLQFLRDQGCALGQGFLIGRPGPPETIEPFLRGTETLWSLAPPVAN